MRLIWMLGQPAALSGFTAGLLVIPLVVVLAYEVFSRYVLEAPTQWSHEVSYMLMGSIFMLAMSYALKTRQHVNVDLIYGNLRPRGRAIIDVLGYGLLLPVLGWMTIHVFYSASEAYATGEVTGGSAWNPVVWPFRVVWLVGFSLLTLQAAVEILKGVVTLVTGREAGRLDE